MNKPRPLIEILQEKLEENGGVPPDLSDSKVVRAMQARLYKEALPKIKAVDELRRRSKERGFNTVIGANA